MFFIFWYSRHLSAEIRVRIAVPLLMDCHLRHNKVLIPSTIKWIYSYTQVWESEAAKYLRRSLCKPRTHSLLFRVTGCHSNRGEDCAWLNVLGTFCTFSRIRIFGKCPLSTHNGRIYSHLYLSRTRRSWSLRETCYLSLPPNE